MALNCAVLHPDRIEEELFGSELSGTVRKGVLDKAQKGTLLLDQIADMPLETQGKIVRVLQEQRFLRVGGGTPVEMDVRVIATTSADLQTAVRNGSFREDLYYRLNVVPVHIPPLRERTQDIAELALYFSRSGPEPVRFSKQALAALKMYPWPGNVRQLKNAVEWMMIMRTSDPDQEITATDLPPEIRGESESALNTDRETEDYMSLSLREAREAFERTYLLQQMKRFDGSVSETAKFVGMERSALHRKLKSLDIYGTDKPSSGQDDDRPVVAKRA